MRVLDASAVVELLFGGDRGRAVAAAMGEDPDDAFHAPDLLDVEVLQALRRLERTEILSVDRATGAAELLARLPVTRHGAAVLGPRIWALRPDLTAYDAAYVALAEALRCPLLTCDARLAAAPGHGATVLVVG